MARMVEFTMEKSSNSLAIEETRPRAARELCGRESRRQLPDLLNLMDDAARVAAAIGPGDWRADDRTVAATGLFRKLRHDVQAAFINLEAGLVGQARVMQRVAFDALVILKLYRFDETYHAEHKREQENFRRYSRKLAAADPGRFGIVDRAEVRQVNKEVAEIPKVTLPRTHELVDRADEAEREAYAREGREAPPNGFRPVYETASRIANLHAHSSIKSIKPYLESLDGGHEHEVDLNDVVLVGVTVVAILVQAIGLLSGVVDDVDVPDEFASVVERHHAFWELLEADARGAA